MIHHTSYSGYSPNCKSSSTAQPVRFIKNEQNYINSENQIEKSSGETSSGDILKLSSIQSPNQNSELKTCIKEQPGETS